MTHQERGRPLIILQWAPGRKTSEINPCRCFHRPPKSTLRKGMQPRQWTARPSKHWRGMTHLIRKEMFGVSCSGCPNVPIHPSWLLLLALLPIAQWLFPPPVFPPGPRRRLGSLSREEETFPDSQPQPRDRSLCPSLCPCLPPCQGRCLPLLPAYCHPCQFAVCNKLLPHQIWAKSWGLTHQDHLSGLSQLRWRWLQAEDRLPECSGSWQEPGEGEEQEVEEGSV